MFRRRVVGGTRRGGSDKCTVVDLGPGQRLMCRITALMRPSCGHWCDIDGLVQSISIARDEHIMKGRGFCVGHDGCVCHSGSFRR